MPTPSDQLETLAAQFELWRQSKAHRNSAAPAPLRQQVVDLLEHFTVNHLKTSLKLSNSVIYRWMKLFGGNIEKAMPVTPHSIPGQTPDFVTLPQSLAVDLGGTLLELAVGNQCHIRLSGDISPAQLDVVTRNIFMYQQGNAA